MCGRILRFCGKYYILSVPLATVVAIFSRTRMLSAQRQRKDAAVTDDRPFRAPAPFLISLYCATASYGTLQSIVVPVLPEITRQLGATHAEAGWVLTAFFLVGGAVTPVLGRLGDLFGNFRMMAGTLVVFSLGTLLALFAPTIQILIIARLMQGVGAALLFVGTACLLLTITQLGTAGWLHPTTLGAAAASFTTLTLWIISEQRARQPLLDVRLLIAPGARLINATTLAAGAFALGGFSLLPIALQTEVAPGLGVSLAVVGVIALPISGLNFVGASFSGRIAARIGTGGMLVLGFALSGVALALVGILHTHPWHVVLAAAIHGFGIGLFFSALPVQTMLSAGVGQSGSASGLFSTLRWVGSAIGTQVVFVLLATPADPGSGIVAAYWAVACFWAVGLAFSFGVSRGSTTLRPE
jgi:predicted MFS family arabinose efflux permease